MPSQSEKLKSRLILHFVQTSGFHNEYAVKLPVYLENVKLFFGKY